MRAQQPDDAKSWTARRPLQAFVRRRDMRLETTLPVVGSTSVMGEREHKQTLRFFAVDDVVRKTLHTPTPERPSKGSACLWVSPDEDHRLLDGSDELGCQTRGALLVEVDIVRELRLALRVEFDGLHCSRERTLEKTSSEGMPSTAPERSSS